MNNTKEVLVKTIKEWMSIENEMKQFQKEIKVRREKKKELSQKLVDIMKKNEIDCFDISEGKIIYTKNNVKTALNKTHILESLNTYFSNNPAVKPDEVTNFILDKRSTVIKEFIRHKPPKIDN